MATAVVTPAVVAVICRHYLAPYNMSAAVRNSVCGWLSLPPYLRKLLNHQGYRVVSLGDVSICSISNPISYPPFSLFPFRHLSFPFFFPWSVFPIDLCWESGPGSSSTSMAADSYAFG